MCYWLSSVKKRLLGYRAFQTYALKKNCHIRCICNLYFTIILHIIRPLAITLHTPIVYDLTRLYTRRHFPAAQCQRACEMSENISLNTHEHKVTVLKSCFLRYCFHFYTFEHTTFVFWSKVVRMHFEKTILFVFKLPHMSLPTVWHIYRIFNEFIAHGRM